MQIFKDSLIECSFDELKKEIITFKFFQYISSPLLSFKMKGAKEDRLWSIAPQSLELYLFSLIPFGTQIVVPQKLESCRGQFKIADNGSGSFFKEWMHIISLTKVSETSVRYKDQITFESKFSNGGSFLFLWLLLVIRHWRLKKFVTVNLFKTDHPTH